MFRAPLRRIRPASVNAARLQVPRRTASTGPAKKGTWKGTAVRWGVAAGAVYWYCTSPLFADDPAPQVAVPVTHEEEEVTVDKVIEQKRKEIEARAREREAKEAEAAREQEGKTQEAAAVPPTEGAPEGSPQALEEEAGQQGAFNPETGEINWDCPCLGGMAHGPCGEEFRAAFSCFVYSEEEPKGMDCIDKFQAMQDCFRKYPDVYGAELAEEEAAEAEARAEAEAEAGKPKPEGEPRAEEKAKPEAEPTEKVEMEEDQKAQAGARPEASTETSESQAAARPAAESSGRDPERSRIEERDEREGKGE